MESKLLISKREKLRLGGGGGNKRGAQRFVVAGLDRGHHPTPYFAVYNVPQGCSRVFILRSPKAKKAARWKVEGITYCYQEV